jgi:hypothetical protein
LAANATYFKGGAARDRQHLPRSIDEFVMGQITDEATLERLPDLTTQTAVVILIETGLRSIDTLRLPFDPITVDEARRPYLTTTTSSRARRSSQSPSACSRRSAANSTASTSASEYRGRPTYCPRSGANAAAAAADLGNAVTAP